MRIHVIENSKVANTIVAESLADAQDLLPGAELIDGATGGIGWTYINDVLAEPVVPLADARAAKLAELSALRYAKETGGVTVGGREIDTSRESRGLIREMFANKGPDATFDYKTKNGWVTINQTQLTAIARAVRRHVQAAFTNERAHHDAIQAATTNAELNAINIMAGW